MTMQVFRRLSLLVLVTALALSSAAPLPRFAPSWSVHEDQFADVTGSRVAWHGTVFNDLTKFPHPGCRSPTSRGPIPNCTATAYVDDAGLKSTYYFFKPAQPTRGVVYFVQPGQDLCYCDMVTLGRWIQCEIPDSLCNPNMVKSATFDGSGSKSFDGKPVDVIEWNENLIIASTQFRLSVQHQTSTPVQYYTTFTEGKNTSLGYNQVNWTKFVPHRPDPSAFALPGRVCGTCSENMCATYEQNIRRGVSPALASSFAGRA